jgi:hypothetical protein
MAKSKYMAILFSLDGEEYVTDFHNSDTPEQVWNAINDMGSRWFFYPISFVTRDAGSNITHQRIIGVPDGLETFGLLGRTVKTAKQWIKDNKPIIEMMLS